MEGVRTILLGFCIAAMGLAQQTADLILVNGRVWTVNASQPEAEAVAIVGPHIAAVGSSANIRKWAGSRTRVIDLAGRRVVPGFNDAHVHFYTGGANLTRVQLRNARSQAEFSQRIQAYASKVPKGRWILGAGWDHENWTPAALPRRKLIDEGGGGHPVCIKRSDGH